MGTPVGALWGPEHLCSPRGSVRGERAVTTEGSAGGFYKIHLCLLAPESRASPCSLQGEWR